MRLPVISIRPEPGCSATVAAGLERGLPIVCHPLFVICPLAWSAPPAESFDALLIGSANAVRYAGAELSKLAEKSVYAVGETTAECARDAGLAVAHVGSGGLQHLLDQVPRPLRLLRIAGRHHVPLDPPPGITIVMRVAYCDVPLPMPEVLQRRFAGGAIVLLHSAGAARHFATQCEARGIDRAQVALAVLGPRIAAAAGGGWRSVRSAPRPRESELLALAQDMWHELAGR